MSSEAEYPLFAIVDFHGTATWREQKAEKHPDDIRNAKAARTLYKLESEAELLKGSPVHRRLLKLWMARPLDDFSFEETVSDELRAIGFGASPKSAKEFLAELVRTLR